MNYTLGLHEVAAGTHAYLQPDGGWGWSNAGLVVGEGVSLLVDTLFDLRITQRMLDTMAPVTAGAPIGTVVNTHANGDHCYGNSLVKGASIVATDAAAHEMREVPPSMLAGLNRAPGEVGEIIAAGPTVFAGYLNRPDATAEAIRTAQNNQKTAKLSYDKAVELAASNAVTYNLTVNQASVQVQLAKSAASTTALSLGSRPGSRSPSRAPRRFRPAATWRRAGRGRPCRWSSAA